jgi:signal transduction histidine kinase
MRAADTPATPAVAAAAATAADPTGDIRGLPLTRFYPFEEIGNVTQGARLAFDAFGRLAVMQDGAYVVLNDATWIDLTEHPSNAPSMLNVVRAADGRLYYGGLGSWGLAEFTAQGKLRARSVVPREHPKWSSTTNFMELVCTPSGVYFAGWSGVVYYDLAARTSTFIEVPEVSRAFKIGDRVFVASHKNGIQAIDTAARAARPVPGTTFGGLAIDQITNLDRDHVLVSIIDGRVYLFDGAKPVRWPVGTSGTPSGRVSAMCRLVDGGVAVAVSGHGLYLLTRTGEVILDLNSPEYHRVTDVATNESGVLWVATENGVEKVLYGSPVTIFGQRLGLPVSWPQVVRWHGRVFIASSGRLYEAATGTPGTAARFTAVPNQPATGAWAIATDGAHLLIGNSSGAFELREDGIFVPVLVPFDVARLVMSRSGLCYVIGPTRITVLRHTDGAWRECAPPIAGVGYPSIVHATDTAAWIELGPNRAARLSLRGSRLEARLFEDYPWHEPRWINIGVVGHTVVLSGPNEGRLYFDEQTETLGDAPALRTLLDQAPYWTTRVREDEHGTLWASYDRGIFTMRRDGATARYDTTTFGIINDRIPLIQMLPGGDVWLSSGQSLYHVDHRSALDPRHGFRPILISVVDGRTNTELFHGPESVRSAVTLPYAENNLSFRFFAGSYAARRAPVYEFRLNHVGGEWTTIGPGSVLNFPELREGHYNLDVRLTDPRGPVGPPLSVDFAILPPWYRTWSAYALYALAALLAMLALVHWSVQHTRARNVVLENLVRERTNELRATMEKLNEETRNAATLAERDRLAGEIHDSVQQGLSGVMLQLDATLKLSALSADVRSRLSVARNMVSFTRHELQHAIWDMESPLLEAADLGQALDKLAGLISPGTARLSVTVSGDPVPLTSSTKHHLLRIGQEAITNAVRHAAADAITVRLAYEPAAIALTVSDDGCGFVPDAVMATDIGHFGLRGLRGRAAKVGGALDIRSEPGRGTTIRIVVPLAALAPVESDAVVV